MSEKKATDQYIVKLSPEASPSEIDSKARAIVVAPLAGLSIETSVKPACWMVSDISGSCASMAERYKQATGVMVSTFHFFVKA